MVPAARCCNSSQSSSSIDAGFVDRKAFRIPCCANRSFTLVCHNLKSVGMAAPDISAFIRARVATYPSRSDIVIFNRFNLNIPVGNIVALVGRNGSGKRTVISLIERFYEPLVGEILLDGNNVRDLDLKWLRQRIGLVIQDPVLFATTIRENILYGKDDATLEEIIRAVKLAEAIVFINNLPDRFETQVL
ncbi:wall-associated receptor kinase-like 1-like [Hibiscus syriacus]|uniref:Wall-associated receptor kinase-like 1-like n=1 Tax=Hibiscus syriacus TaxID=106335 RepID=A0A6A2WRY1_HIBSY|nr:wall-associated receptor kinase-like 1-like [Hibiscus syriacus]